MSGWRVEARVPGWDSPWVVEWEAGALRTDPVGLLSELVAEEQETVEVRATPTGPYAPADLTVSHVAFSLVRSYLWRYWGVRELRVTGRDWQWPEPDDRAPADAVF
jgi:hypothetical protein